MNGFRLAWETALVAWANRMRDDLKAKSSTSKALKRGPINPYEVGDRVRIVVREANPLWKASEEWRQYLDGREGVIVRRHNPTPASPAGRCFVELDPNDRDEAFKVANLDVRMLMPVTPILRRRVKAVAGKDHMGLESAAIENLDEVPL